MIIEKEALEKDLKQMSIAQIATKYNCGETTVYRAIKKYDLKKEKPNYQNKEWLKEELKHKSAKEIAEDEKVNEHTIYRWINCFKLIKTVPLYQNKEWFEEQAKNFNSLTDIAAHYGFKRDTIDEWARTFGITFNKCKKSNFEENYFQNIDTEHKAYWLGFFMADACIDREQYNFQFGLMENDRYMLEKFLSEIKYKTKIDDRTGGFDTPCCYITVCSIKMVRDLIYLGVVPRKSGRETFPTDLIPKDLQRHFIRGFLDGDGWITYNDKRPKCNIGWCSMSLNILIDIKDFLENELNLFDKGKIRKRKDKNKLYDLTFNTSNAIKVLDYLYENATIFLDRKYKKYDSVLKAQYKQSELREKNIADNNLNTTK